MTHETIVKPDMIIAEFQAEKTRLEREREETKEKVKKPIGQTAGQECLVIPDHSEVHLVPDNGQYTEPIKAPPTIDFPNYPA